MTRGDVPMRQIRDSLPFPSVVWNNDERGVDFGVFGRYAVIAETQAPVIFVQDDDLLLPPESIASLLAAYEPGKVVCNMPPLWAKKRFYQEHALVGFGAVFDRMLPQWAFDRFAPTSRRYARRDPTGDGFSTWFNRTCDIVFTHLTPRVLVDVPYQNLPHATAPDRMYRNPRHQQERRAMLNLARKA